MYQSNYNGGLRVFDITDREDSTPVGFFDTVPGEDFPSMDGSWSNYPFFRSGIVVATSGWGGALRSQIPSQDTGLVRVGGSPGKSSARAAGRPVPRDKKAAVALKKRTLTNLYNTRPQIGLP